MGGVVSAPVKAIKSLIRSSVGLPGKVIGGVLGGVAPKMPTLPTPAAPEKKRAMPTTDDSEVERARRRAIAARRAASGRASTILSEGSGGKLG